MQNTGTGITNFRTIGTFSRDKVEDLVKRVCARIGKPWETLTPTEQAFYLTAGANALANRPFLLARTDDLPNLDDAKLVEFHQLFVASMRDLPGWNVESWIQGYPIDGIKQGGGVGVGSQENQQESRR